MVKKVSLIGIYLKSLKPKRLKRIPKSQKLSISKEVKAYIKSKKAKKKKPKRYVHKPLSAKDFGL